MDIESLELTCEKYGGSSHLWSSKREHCTRSNNSKRSCVAPLNLSGLWVRLPPLPFVVVPAIKACWRLKKKKQNMKLNFKI